MSRVKLEMIWRHQQVLPYILGPMLHRLQAITPVHKMYLVGSRGRVPVSSWQSLEGKDWDILAVCGFPIVNTEVWTAALNYHIDLVVVNEAKAPAMLHNAKGYIELYPQNLLQPLLEKP
jgi:hypothetical protein